MTDADRHESTVRGPSAGGTEPVWVGLLVALGGTLTLATAGLLVWLVVIGA